MAVETPSKIDVWVLFRYALIVLGSSMATRGSVDIDPSEIEIAAGALVTIASILWGVYVRWNTRSVPLEVAVRPDIPVKSSATGKITHGAGA